MKWKDEHIYELYESPHKLFANVLFIVWTVCVFSFICFEKWKIYEQFGLISWNQCKQTQQRKLEKKKYEGKIEKCLKTLALCQTDI